MVFSEKSKLGPKTALRHPQKGSKDFLKVILYKSRVTKSVTIDSGLIYTLPARKHLTYSHAMCGAYLHQFYFRV